MPVNNPGGSSSFPYLVYSALMNQSGVAAPTATILQNTLGAIVWSRLGVGSYAGTLAGVFTANKTFCLIGSSGDFTGSDPDMQLVQLSRGSINHVFLNSITNGAGNFSTDDSVIEVSIEIRVYP